MAIYSLGVLRGHDIWFANVSLALVSVRKCAHGGFQLDSPLCRWSKTEQFTGTFKVMQKTMQHYYTKINEATRIKAMPSILACSAEVCRLCKGNRGEWAWLL